MFPWLLSTSPSRIPKYPYRNANKDWIFLNYLPRFVQKSLSQFICDRIVTLNTGADYYPEQFLVGAGMACRHTLETLSRHLTNPQEETEEALSLMMSLTLLERLETAACYTLEKTDVVEISLPQIYDANVKDTWVTMGNSEGLEDSEKYETMEWNTLQIYLKRSVFDDHGESYRDYRAKTINGLMEGVQIAVDVEIDADIHYSIKREGNVLIEDRGRRSLVVRLESPYFEPAHEIVSGRDEAGNPINEWSWIITDLDYLLEKDKLDEEAKEQ
ncbi:hypothetical protein BDF14DRAFT_1745943 [Spinellus fusiger]|nr:hypothetical protein BDF14DRAFT_1745943 [Spinellus fusiger]